MDEPRGTRARLLEAAGEVFAAEGFRGATVRSICERAGANLAAVNYHFGSKQALYRETLRHAFESARRRHPARFDGEDVPEQVRSFVLSMLRRLYSVGRSWQGRLVARELADPSEALQEVAETHIRPLIEGVDALVERARPDLDPDARRLYTFGLIGQCVFFRHARPVLDRLFGPEAFGEEQIPALGEHIASSFLKTLGLEVRA